MKKQKLIITALLLSILGVLTVLLFTDRESDEMYIGMRSVHFTTADGRNMGAWVKEYTFEQIISRHVTDVVIVRYVGSRSFERELTEFEFIVLDRVLGNATDRIFVYADEYINTAMHGQAIGDFGFTCDTDYLLPLTASISPYRFLGNIIIDLNNPSNSVMYGEPLSQNSTGLDFSDETSREQIISHIEYLTKNISPVITQSED